MTTPLSSRTLVSVGELQRHLGDPRWRVIDVRHDLMDTSVGMRAYAAGHIPGAEFAHIDNDLSGPKTGRNGRHPLPDRLQLAQRFRDWGIDDDTQIVAYDAQGGQFAGRLWWLARWLGHATVALLDGGWHVWLAKTGLSSTEPPAPRTGRFTARAPLVAALSADDVLQSLRGRDRLVLDARTEERFRGDVEPVDPVAGHIPGAWNRPWQSNLAPDQTFKAPEVLRREFDALLGKTAVARVVHQCGSGVTACHNIFAMELAGLPGSALYAGSWSEWIADPTRPIATGDEPPPDRAAR